MSPAQRTAPAQSDIAAMLVQNKREQFVSANAYADRVKKQPFDGVYIMGRKQGSKVKWLFLLIGCDQFKHFPPLPALHDIYAFMRLAQQTRDAQVYHLLNPTKEGVITFLHQKTNDLKALVSDDAVLVLLVSTHGFEANGQACFAWQDSQREQPNTLMTLSSLQASTVPWFKDYPQRTAILLQQTCRESLNTALGEPDEQPTGTWSILEAVPAGGAEEGWTTLTRREQNEYYPAGRLTRRLFALWKELTKSIPLNVLTKLLTKIYQDEGLIPPNWEHINPQSIWPPIEHIRYEPPEEFKGHLFTSFSERDVLYGRENATEMALGIRYDRDLHQPGWLFETKQTLLYGSSGSGKTSFVRAGLLPSLRKSSLPESQASYVDVSTQGLPSLDAEPNPPKCLFLDQIEGFLVDGRFEQLKDCIQTCQTKDIRLVLMLREDFVGAWERLSQDATTKWNFSRRLLKPLLREEAQAILDGNLPASCLTDVERQKLLDGVGLASSQSASEHTLNTFSPVLLQVAMNDAWQRREKPEGQRVRPLFLFWQEHWQNVMGSSSSGREALWAVLSAFLPLQQARINPQSTQRRLFTAKELFGWLKPLHFSDEQVIQQSCDHLVHQHWLREVGKGEEKAYILSHDFLLHFLSGNINEDAGERKRRVFLRRLQEALDETHTSSLEASLRGHFQAKEWERLREEAAFWWQWLEYEGFLPQHLNLDGLTTALDTLLRKHRRRTAQLGSVSAFLLLLLSVVAAFLWVETSLRSQIELCTEAQDITLPFDKFRRCTQALVRIEQRWWNTPSLQKKTITLFDALQTKQVPINWWGVVPSTLQSTRSFFVRHTLALETMDTQHWRAWAYLLRSSLHNAGRYTLAREEHSLLSRPLGWKGQREALELWQTWLTHGGHTTPQDRTLWLAWSKDSEPERRQAALKLWIAWLSKAQKPTTQEHKAWLDTLKDSDHLVRSAALSLWMAWFKNGGKPTTQERKAWLDTLRDSDHLVRSAALSLWIAWFKNGGIPTAQERKAWLNMLKHSNEWMQLSVLEAWGEWFKNGSIPTIQERKELLNTLKYSNECFNWRTSLSVLKVWKAWVNNGGKPTTLERLAWLNMLTHSGYSLRSSALEVWKAWLEKGGQPTTLERLAWLNMLTHSGYSLRSSALEVWKAWVKNGGIPTKQERDVWLTLLKYSEDSVRLGALDVWKAWAKNGGQPTTQERDAWLALLKHSEKKVQWYAFSVWYAWVKNRGQPTTQERDAWLTLLKHPEYPMQWCALNLWKAWYENGGQPTTQERDTWLAMLKDPSEDVRSTALKLSEVWLKNGGKPTTQERDAWLTLLKHSEKYAALNLWEAWFKNGGQPTRQERKTWLAMLKNSEKYATLSVWYAWFKNGGNPTTQERDAWLTLLKHSEKKVRLSALDVWYAWVKNGGNLTTQERKTWLAMLKNSEKKSALKVWRAWVKKGGNPTAQERDVWLTLLKKSEDSVQWYALDVWYAWVKNGGNPTKQERDVWLTLLKKSEDSVRLGALDVWKAWVKKGGNPTAQERDTWLTLLKHSEKKVRLSALEVWKAWVKKGGNPTKQERKTWIAMLKHSKSSVRLSALEVWKAWVKNGGQSTPEERKAWFDVHNDPDEDVRQKATKLWKVWGFANVSRLCRAKKHRAPNLESWLEQAIIWDAVVSGEKALKKYLASEALLAEALRISRYPVFQHITRQVLAKKRTSPSPSTQKNSLPKKRLSPALQRYAQSMMALENWTYEEFLMRISSK